VRACVRACVRVHACLCACMCACVQARVYVYSCEWSTETKCQNTQQPKTHSQLSGKSCHTHTRIPATHSYVTWRIHMWHYSWQQPNTFSFRASLGKVNLSPLKMQSRRSEWGAMSSSSLRGHGNSTRTHTRAQMHTHTHTHTNIKKHTHTRTHTHTQTHLYIHTRIHTRTRDFLMSMSGYVCTHI